MARGSKASYSSKQKRQAEHIEDSEKKQGRSKKVAERIAWATVNKQTGGAAKKKKKSSVKKAKKAVKKSPAKKRKVSRKK